VIVDVLRDAPRGDGFALRGDGYAPRGDVQCGEREEWRETRVALEVGRSPLMRLVMLETCQTIATAFFPRAILFPSRKESFLLTIFAQFHSIFEEGFQ